MALEAAGRPFDDEEIGIMQHRPHELCDDVMAADPARFVVRDAPWFEPRMRGGGLNERAMSVTVENESFRWACVYV